MNCCKAKGCWGVVQARGLCHTHYMRLLRKGDYEEDRPIEYRDFIGCSVPGCDSVHMARKLCRLHYFRWWKYGDPLVEVPKYASKDEFHQALMQRGLMRKDRKKERVMRSSLQTVTQTRSTIRGLSDPHSTQIPSKERGNV